MQQFKRDTVIEVEVYRIDDYRSMPRPYEKHHKNSGVKVTPGMQKIRFLKGDHIIWLNQPANRYLVEMLEPTGDDSFFAWNFFDAVLQQKEGYSDYRWDDLARGQLYMVTRYENLVSGWQGNANANDILNGTPYPAFDNWYIKMLFKWHLNDPVSTKEINRNNAVFAIQGNRNPYIDHPEYVYLVWECTGILPVNIIDFTAQNNNETVLLKWYATNEANFKKYEIERSIDGTGFYKIGEVAGSNLANYSFTDKNLPNANTVFYRLKMIDIDGQFSNSKIISVRIANNFSNAQVYPNPTKDRLVIKLQQALNETSRLIIADISGRIVMQQQVAGVQSNIDLTVSHLPAGRYFIKISNAAELINQSFVIIK